MTTTFQIADGATGDREYVHRRNLIAGDAIEIRVNGIAEIRIEIRAGQEFDAVAQIAGTARTV